MYLEWYLKEKKAYEKTLEETVTELLSEKHLHGIDFRVLYRRTDFRNTCKCGRRVCSIEMRGMSLTQMKRKSACFEEFLMRR